VIEATPGLRLDKWLWHARFFKTRSLASQYCLSGRLRVNGVPTAKAHYAARVGDVLTFPLGDDIRVVKIVALGERRGPAPEAQTLYEDLTVRTPRRETADDDSPAAREPGAGRPTKSDRRAIDRLMDR
jgi:ribosome-associated heat shock protein Hsp15